MAPLRWRRCQQADTANETISDTGRRAAIDVPGCCRSERYEIRRTFSHAYPQAQGQADPRAAEGEGVRADRAR